MIETKEPQYKSTNVLLEILDDLSITTEKKRKSRVNKVTMCHCPCSDFKENARDVADSAHWNID